MCLTLTGPLKYTICQNKCFLYFIPKTSEPDLNTRRQVFSSQTLLLPTTIGFKILSTTNSSSCCGGYRHHHHDLEFVKSFTSVWFPNLSIYSSLNSANFTSVTYDFLTNSESAPSLQPPPEPTMGLKLLSTTSSSSGCGLLTLRTVTTAADDYAAADSD